MARIGVDEYYGIDYEERYKKLPKIIRKYNIEV